MRLIYERVPARDSDISKLTDAEWRSFFWLLGAGASFSRQKVTPHHINNPLPGNKPSKGMSSRSQRPKARPSRRTRHTKEDTDIYAALNDFTDGIAF